MLDNQIIIVLTASALALGSSVLIAILILKRKPKDAETQKPEIQAPVVEVEQPPAKPIETPWGDRLKKGLSRSRQEVWGKVLGLFGDSEMNDSRWEEIEELLYSADVGPAMAKELLAHLQTKLRGQTLTPAALKDELYNFLKGKLQNIQVELDPALFKLDRSSQSTGPKVIMIVGVNGVGKTTTIGKLATKLTQQGAKVVVGACDTFRAAAVDQLQVWCDRSGATMIRAKEGSAPSGVGYQALEKAIQMQADYCLLDTAGRLHTKENLMEELKKSKNVLSKLDASAPHHVLLVLDAITGQNALRQAQEFHKTLGLTGLIFTKCDGSSKAGSALGIMQDLKVPISYIGVGESVQDLNAFNLDDYLHALLDV